MKRYLVFFAYIILTSNILFSQPGERQGMGGDFKGEVSGQIIENKSSKPIEYASISLFRLRDTTLVTGTISDAKGYFKMTDVPGGKYILRVDFIGFKRYSTEIMVNPRTPSVNTGAIKLEPYTQQLGEVTVADQKPLVEFSLDKKIINVEQNIVADGGSATDILRNTPAVSVDMDGNVSLRGSTNVKILIDGKPSTLSSNPADALEQIPASSIQSIEIITNPSAKYDPEGMTGILNIITKKEKRSGINGLASVNYGTWNKYGASVNLNYRINKINLFAGYDFRSEERNGYRSHIREMIQNDTSTYYTIFSDTQREILSNSLRGGFDFEFNPKNTITLSANYRNGGHPGFSDGSYVIKDYNYNLISDYSRDEISEKDDNISTDFSFNYKKKFNRPIQELSFDAYYSLGNNEDIENYDEVYNYPAETKGLNQKSETFSNRSNIVLQSDYIHPLTETMKLESGLKATFREMDTDYKFYDFDTLAADYFTTNLSNHFIYNDEVYAAYGIVSGSIKKFTVQGGLRFEHSIIKGNQTTTNEKFSIPYYDFFPSVHTTYSLPAENKVQLSYSRRINRPRERSLNPFIDASDPLTLRTGNPQLKPEYINSYELSHIKDWKKVSFTSSIFYKNIENIISMYRITNDTLQGILVTPINANSGNSYGLDFIITWQPVKAVRMSADFSYYNTSINGNYEDNDLTNDIYSYDGKYNATIMLPKDISMQVNFRLSGPSVMPQSIRQGFWTADAALRKDFFSKKLSVSFRISDIFNTMYFRNKTREPNLIADMEFKRETRVAYLTLSYRINEGVKQRTRKPNQDSENDMIEVGE